MEQQKFVVHKPHNEKNATTVREYVIYKLDAKGEKQTPGAVLTRPQAAWVYSVYPIKEILEIDREHKGTYITEDLEFLLREYFRDDNLRAQAREILSNGSPESITDSEANKASTR